MKFLTLNLFILLGFSINVKAASFNCSADLNKTEKAICSNTALNLLDEQLSKLYSIQLKVLTKADKANYISKQRTWLRDRNRRCASNINCLVTSYVKRIEELNLAPEKIAKASAKFIHKPKLESFKIEKKCDFSNVEFSPNLIVYAGGAYSGYKTNLQIDQSGHQTTRFDVAVNSPDAPVALILGAYEPSIWNIKWTEKTNISAVYASGYHRQVVTGLPRNVPVITSSSRETPKCRGNQYISPKKLGQINPLSKSLFEKKASLVTFAKEGKLGFGQAFNTKTQFFTNSESTIEDFIDPSMPLAGKPGLEKLLSEGYLRKANKQDSNKWAELTAKYLKENLPTKSGKTLESRYKPKFFTSGYVILKNITIPAGLFGAHSTTFFLESGVSFPEGSLGHSNLYDFNTMKCHGTMCERNAVKSSNLPTSKVINIDKKLVLGLFDRAEEACKTKNPDKFFNLFSKHAKSGKYGMLTYSQPRLERYMKLICKQLKEEFVIKQFNNEPHKYQYGILSYPENPKSSKIIYDTRLCVYKKSICEKSISAIIANGELKIDEH
jgi:uncharacterized protein